MVVSNFEYLEDYTAYTFSKSSPHGRNIHRLIKRSDPFFLGSKFELENSLHDASKEYYKLSLNSFNQSFTLLLEPSENVLHPNAVVNIVDASGKMHSSPLSSSDDAKDILLLKGIVVDDKLNHIDYATIFENEDVLMNWIGNQGELNHHVVGWAALTVTNPHEWNNSNAKIEGTFSAYGESYTIQTDFTFSSTQNTLAASKNLEPRDVNRDSMVIFRRSDIHDEGDITHRCGFEDSGFNHIESVSNSYLYNNPGHSMRLTRRAPSGCPTSQKMVYMSVVLDCNFVSQFKGDVAAAKNRTLTSWNIISQLYQKSFNIGLGIVNLTILPTCNNSTDYPFNVPCSASYQITQRLSDFSKWRGTQKDDISLYHLVTGGGCGTGPTIGIAWLNTLCVKDSWTQNLIGGGSETVTGAGVSAAVSDEWQVIGHEIGHNFGAVHDCVSQNSCSNVCDAQTGISSATGSLRTAGCECCACQQTDTTLTGSQCSCGGKYLMNPSQGSNQFVFSPCTANLICSKIGYLDNPGSQPIISLAVCGNGVREDGEDCDCGGEAGCQNNKCCQANCKFRDNAKCDDSSDACCKDCQIVSNSTQPPKVCRPARSSCDIAEYCDGTSRNCPTDKFLQDGNTCSDVPNSKCASGECTNRDLQCKIRGSMGNPSNNITVTNYITGACIEMIGSCSLMCNHVTLGCQQFVGNFLDGTDCAGGGVCSKGVCSGAQWYNKVLDWIVQNKQFSIPIIAVIGLILISCLATTLTRKKRMARRVRVPNNSNNST
ncbi:hypothetical protein HK098_003194 [Nowakowskiella sp. JEL0407]|nr:hypothetical protein HK098_003194 [Nowakowskiella sp. JEL0407]